MVLTLVRYVTKAALRDRVLTAMIGIFFLIFTLSVFSASAAIVESQAFVLVFAAGGMRIAGVVGLVLFVSFYIRRSAEAGDIELILSRPLNRGQFVLAYGAAFCLLALLVTLMESAAIYGLSLSSFGQAHLLWIASMAVENMIMAMISFFFAMVLSNAALSCLAALAFYILSRMIGQLFGILQAGEYHSFQSLVEIVINIIAVIIPRLDLMGQTSWLIFGLGKESVGFIFVAGQGVLFLLLIFLATLVDLKRRKF